MQTNESDGIADTRSEKNFKRKESAIKNWKKFAKLNGIKKFIIYE